MAVNRKKEQMQKKQQKVTYRVHRKIAFIFLIVGVFFLILGARIFLINYESGDKYSKSVLDHQHYSSTTIPYKRGQILDRNGTQFVYSEKVYNLIFDPKVLLSSDEKYKEPTMNALIQYFNIPRQDIEVILRDKPNSSYEKLLSNLTADQTASFNEFVSSDEGSNIKGIWFEDAYIRKYPYNSFACDVIGYASQSGGGIIGLEMQYNSELSGIDGVTYGYINDGLNIETTTKDPIDGNNIITTLDYGVQTILEKHIKAFNTEYGSKNTAVVVMNPNNGEILGMASYPFFDLNNPRDLTSLYTEEELAQMSEEEKNNAIYSLWANFCVSSIYEPGSTYKPFTVSAAMEENFAADSDTYYCSGSEVVGGWTIRCHEKGGHGTISLKESIMYSCNPAMMQIAAKMGGSVFGKYQKLFGLGSKTGIDLPGEETGILINGDMMGDSDLATASFGQNFNVTMVQMASAFSSLVNGGSYYKPHVVKRIESANGEIVKNNSAELVRQTVTKSTSEYIKTYLKATVDDGLAKKAAVKGYSVGGKTGTAQKQPREDEKYVISFLGCAPAEDPQFVLYIVIDEPEVEGYNGSSQPVLWLTKDIMSDLLPYLNVFKNLDTEGNKEDGNAGTGDASQTGTEGTEGTEGVSDGKVEAFEMGLPAIPANMDPAVSGPDKPTEPQTEGSTETPSGSSQSG